MKNTLLFSTLVIGIALAGCARETRTSTAATDPTTTTDTTTTVDTTRTTPTTPPATTKETETLGSRMDRAVDRTAAATRDAADRVGDAAREAGAEMREAGRDISAKLREWRLSASDIEADLKADRDIVRTKSTAGAPAGNVNEDTIENAIKGRLKASEKLAGLSFDVNANRRGEVELEGKANNADQIGHAMAIALDTEGVAKVTSKIKLDKDAGANR